MRRGRKIALSYTAVFLMGVLAGLSPGYLRERVAPTRIQALVGSPYPEDGIPDLRLSEAWGPRKRPCIEPQPDDIGPRGGDR